MSTGQATRPDSIRAFLEHKARSEALMYGAGAFLLGLTGLVTVWLAWMLFELAFLVWMDSKLLAGIAALAIVAVLFVLNWQISPDLTPQLRFFEEDDGTLVVLLVRPDVESWRAAFQEPEGGAFIVRLFTSVFFIGPKMVNLSWRLWRRAWTLHQLDTKGCARIVAMLMKSDSRVSFPEIVRKLEHKVNLRSVLPQMRSLTGAVFLSTDPMGMTLTPMLREEILEWKKQRGQSDPEFQFED